MSGLLAADAVFQPGLLGTALLLGIAGLVALAAAAAGATKGLPAIAVPAIQAQPSPSAPCNCQTILTSDRKALPKCRETELTGGAYQGAEWHENLRAPQP